MASKNNIVSIILFALSSILFVIFSLTIFFGGQKIGGAIYFIYFVIMLGFAFLDRKYASNFMYFYRFSAYFSDAFNILALGSLIYYKIYLPQTIASISLLAVAFFVDLFSKNRSEKRRLGSILVRIFNCALMFVIFPFFFEESLLPLDLAITGVVFSVSILLSKLVLALVPYHEEMQEKKDDKIDLADKVRENAEPDLE